MHPTRLRLRAVRLAIVVAVALLVPLQPAAAAPPSTDPLLDADVGAHWLAGLVNASGFVPGPTNAPNVRSPTPGRGSAGGSGACIARPQFTHAIVRRPADARFAPHSQTSISSLIVSRPSP